VVARLYTLSAEVKEARAERELQQKRWAEEERRRQRRAHREHLEAKRFEALREQAARWKLAGDIRAYVEAAKHDLTALLATVEGERLGPILDWALAHADRIDPLKVAPPELSNLAAHSGAVDKED
jgi:hypothetical protein